MAQLRGHGVSFSLDDFGTGYSSLYYLKRLAVNELKSDKRFVADVTTDASDAALVRAMLGMAATLGLEVVAEGVETGPVFEWPQEHGCSRFRATCSVDRCCWRH